MVFLPSRAGVSRFDGAPVARVTAPAVTQAGGGCGIFGCMSVSAALLRLLLSLVLVLNGIGAVAASARMAGAMDSAHHAPVAKHAAAEHCARSALAEATADAHAGHDGHSPAPPCSDHAKPDCCDSSACSCACAQNGSTALFAVVQLSPVFLHGHFAPSPIAGHAAPALAFPIRPPIA